MSISALTPAMFGVVTTPGMSKEKEDAFFAEARRLFSEAGYETSQ